MPWALTQQYMVRTQCLLQWKTEETGCSSGASGNSTRFGTGRAGARVALAQIPRLAGSSCCPPSPPPANHSPLCWCSQGHSVLSFYCYLPLLGTVGRRQPLAVRELPAGCCWASPAYPTGCSGKHGAPHPSCTIQIPYIPNTYNTVHKHAAPPTVKPHTHQTHQTHTQYTHSYHI